MASSDEEGEIIPQCITNYYFVNFKEEPVPFTILPLQWSEDVIPEGLKEQIYFHGTVDNGLQEIYKQAIAWKFELSYVHPEILVLSKGKNWIKLQRPRKSFESIVKNALVTVHCLHLVKKNPEASGESLWNHLLKSFGSYEVKPSENDLLDHMPLIGEAAKRDKDLEKSKYLLKFILEKSGEKKVPHEDVRTTKNLKFVVDEDDDEDEECDEDANELFDHVCTICDNGGELLCCEGRCMRSFHPTVDSGAESLCESLGFSNTQVDAIQTFLCKNCQYQQHQCFACGMLGSSDKYSGAEVFPCVSATCGHFYHPECVVKLLHPGNENEAEELQNKILAGESFTCPAHKCYLCKQGENKMVHELQFAMCRRCPKAYHRKCLPRKIAFGCDYYKGIIQRAWDDLLPNRILIYCLKHKISLELGTPERNHIIFPDVEVKMKKRTSELLSSKVKVVEKNRIMVSKNFQIKKAALKMPKHVEKLYSTVEDGYSTKKNERRYLRQDFDSSKKRKITDLTTKSLSDNIKSAAVMKAYKSSREDESKLLLRNDELTSLPNMALNPVKPKQRWQNMPSGKIEYIKSAKPVMKKGSSSRPSVDTEMEKRIVALMEKCDSSFNLEEFMEKLKVPSTHSYLSKNVVDKTITLGKVEGSVKAVQAALQKLEGGCSIEDAKAVCEPQVLNQIIKWKRKLSIYLAPFLIGTRYTSFGRHFTKVEKLKEIVDRLHPYVQNGDMIVDFCCGSNDFSCLMKEKLDKMGKKCSFKNFDLFQAKNDFCFEKRDWMSVHSEELPAGSQLIMGLNPPFGAEASLANKFVDKALGFKPKLLILIVPEETKRLDEKAAAYDLIWKDDKILSGKSFYLPGSVDVHDKQLEQWNLKAPPLYLWSHPDWTARHKIIAQKHRHFSKEQEKMYVEVNNIETVVSNYLMEENHDCYADFSSLVGADGDISSILDDIPEDNDETGPEGTKTVPCKPKESLPLREDSSEHWKNEDYTKVRLLENLNEMQCEGNQQSGQAEASLQGKLDDGRSPESREMCIDMELSTPINSPFDCTDLQSLLEDKPYENFEAPEMEARGEGLRDIQPSSSGNDLKFGTEYGGSQTANPSRVESRYGLVNEETFINGTHYHTNLGFNLWPRTVEDQFHVYKNDTAAGLHPEYNLNELEKQRRETTNTGAHLPLYGQQQGHNSLSGAGILPYQYSEFFQVGSLPSDPCGHVGYVANNAALCTQTGSVDASMSTQITFVSLAENYTAPAP